MFFVYWQPFIAQGDRLHPSAEIQRATIHAMTAERAIRLWQEECHVGRVLAVVDAFGLPLLRVTGVL